MKNDNFLEVFLSIFFKKKCRNRRKKKKIMCGLVKKFIPIIFTSVILKNLEKILQYLSEAKDPGCQFI